MKIKTAKFISIVLLLLVPVFVWQTDWFDDGQSWQEASGYNKIAEGLKPAPEFFNDEGLEIYWLGHSGFIIFWEGQTILLDPNLSSSVSIIHRATKSFASPEELPKVDAAVISHAHADHLDLPTLENISRLENVIVPKRSDVFLSERIKEDTNIVGLDESEAMKVGGITITAVKAVHNGSRYHPFGSNYKALGYVISNSKRSIYFAGDTGWGEHFLKIKEQYHPEIAILPIGGYEPYFILKNYHLNPQDAAKAGRLLNALIIPSHFGTFRVALEPTTTALTTFAKAAKEQKAPWQLARPFSISLKHSDK